MTGAKFDIEKFDETGDLGLWRVKMSALLIQHGCEAALEVLPADMKAQAKAELNKKAHSIVILCLGNKVLREVTRETTASGVWSKLETLYMTKSLAKKLYLKKKFYTFYMPAGRKISEHIYEFNKIILDLENIEVKFKNEDLALLLLTSLPASYEHFMDTLLYGREALTLEDRWKTHVLYFPIDDHLKRNCPKNNRKKSRGYVNKDDQPSFSGSIYDGSEVMMVMNVEALLDWIMDSGGLYHMTPRVVLSGTRRDNCVYSLDGHVVAGELNDSVEEKDSFAWVWHKRLEHISEAGLQVLEKQGLFGKKSLGELDFCENFVLGKSHQEFKQLCIKSGIARHLTVARTPQQNGLAERMNRTLMDKTPMEMWSGHPSDYGMLRTFGCVTYLHVKQGKLEPRAVKCFLLGYPEGVKGYRLYRLDNESPKIVTSRNVVFNESVMYKDTLKDSGAGIDKSVEELHVEVELQRLNYQLVRDREPRTRMKPLRFQDESNMAAYAFATAKEEDTHEPLIYQEAVACEDSSKQKLVSCKWLFKIKEWIEGVQRPRYKARLVARGFTHRADELEQLDVKTTFLHGNLEEMIYMRQPPGYEQGNKVCLLKKSLYGLKQSPRQWYRRFDEYILSNGFKRNSYDNCVYHKSYALGPPRLCLKGSSTSQSGYVFKILNNIRIYNEKSVQMPLGGHFKLSLKDCPVRGYNVERMSKVPYANAVGSLMYLMVCMRPDIAYAASIVSRYLANPGKKHWEAVKWILKYLRGTVNVGLVYGTNHSNHVDVTGFLIQTMLRIRIKVETEYMALTEAVKEAIWLRGLLKELGVELNRVTVNCNNQGAIHLSRNHAFHERTKHINVRYHFLREVLKATTIEVLKVGTEHNVADAMMKVVPGHKLQHCLELLSVGIG
uniref:Retrotransposon protein, putative, Ty1-copia subclass n=1 Tax=Tanacetum cinerariifolium TaxID=118510 RepID=A0A699HEC0_TANCI|nr:retrotransposon protein, putative, Ty1-copia subclass [Tanacetum cinerariifolium]